MAGFDITGVRNRAAKPNFWYRAMCFGLCGKREEPLVPGARGGKELHRPLEQPPGDPLVPEIRPHRQGAEAPEAAPPGDEVRSDELPVDLGGDGGSRIGAPSGADVIGVAGERQGIGQTEERAECHPEDAVRGGDLPLLQRSDGNLHRVLVWVAAPAAKWKPGGPERPTRSETSAQGRRPRLRRRRRSAKGGPISGLSGMGRDNRLVY
jgi:hypothetical protein